MNNTSKIILFSILSKEIILFILLINLIYVTFKASYNESLEPIKCFFFSNLKVFVILLLASFLVEYFFYLTNLKPIITDFLFYQGFVRTNEIMFMFLNCIIKTIVAILLSRNESLNSIVKFE